MLTPLIGLLMGLAVANHAQAAQAVIAVAANFTDAAREIVPLFEKQSGHQIKVSYGSTGKLYAQITNGAPYHVFLAADAARPAKLEQDQQAVKGSRFTYAKGRLVLWSATPDLFSDGPAYLKQNTFRRAAIANPKTAPYGLAAKQVMEKLNIWQNVRGKLVRGDSIAQTFQFTATGNADVGFIALAQLKAQLKAWQGDGSHWQIPQSYHAPIAQQAVLLKKGADNPAAVAFIAFLKGPQAQALIRNYGYDLEE